MSWGHWWLWSDPIPPPPPPPLHCLVSILGKVLGLCFDQSLHLEHSCLPADCASHAAAVQPQAEPR